jgi:hypothetical protein
MRVSSWCSDSLLRPAVGFDEFGVFACLIVRWLTQFLRIAVCEQSTACLSDLSSCMNRGDQNILTDLIGYRLTLVGWCQFCKV